MDDFYVLSLGSASALPSIEMYPTAHIVKLCGRCFLIDCGEGIQMQCCKYGISLLNIEAAFITHLHGDHIFGIFGLLSTFNMLNRSKPFTLYAPAEFEAVLQFAVGRIGSPLSYELRFVPEDAESHVRIVDEESFEVWTLPLHHSVPACGYLFREKTPKARIIPSYIKEYGLTFEQIRALKAGTDVMLPGGQMLASSRTCYVPYYPRSFACCTDTAFLPAIAPMIEGCDLLFHEATYLDKDADKASRYLHSTAADAARIAQMARVGKLIIGHFSTRYKSPDLFLDEARRIFPDTCLSLEGTIFALEKKNTKPESV